MQAGRSDYFGLLIKRGNETFQFEISDVYDQSITGFSGDLEYYGYLCSVGNYIIQQHTISTGKYQYVFGKTGYAALQPFLSNLAALAGLAWKNYDQIFS
jgi:hypothetical protein